MTKLHLYAVSITATFAILPAAVAAEDAAVLKELREEFSGCH